ncbi:PREDICTED: uncharacterized protein LOC104807415 isoform X3 [Tarenaya hassleriana]|uniref:uncharacterized protein LOC104807415 isoform X3 n=1 Tax=Tarenaya hassleriana TaxID=28532 RepID=UPI00053C15E9|nr:PREDICTED: uncharacterized protein LOC104807415 isoform X3 [Tarenaya hassleriana]
MAEGKFDLPDDLILSKSSDQLKDQLVSENSIPLSPQWLYTRPSESRMDVRSPTPVPLGNPNDPNAKEVWRLDGSEDKRDWRKTVPESETTRRWREEERETGLLGPRRDRRKTERRIDNVLGRETNESKNTASSDRWHEVNARAAVHESRRDGKWSSRWGPEEKEKESRSEKKIDMDKEKEKEEVQNESQSLVNSVRTTSERDHDARDKWRPRHRMESQSGGPNSYRAAPGFGLDRGRTEGPNLGFTVGRGRSSAIGRGSSIGVSALFMNENIPGKPSPSAYIFQYPRGKLLDMYRRQKLDPSFERVPLDMEEVAPLTQVCLTEPLAFIAPDAEEEASLSDIWKGKIISSEVHSSFGQESFGENNLVEHDILPSGETTEAEDALVGVMNDNNGAVHDNATGLLANGGARGASSSPGLNPVASKTNGYGTGPEMVSSAFARSSVLDEREYSTSFDARCKLPDDSGSLFVPASLEQDYTRKIQQPDDDMEGKYLEKATPPEEMMLFYIDPQGDIQGPFPDSDVILWFGQGFFGPDLQVRLADAPEKTPFRDLGEFLPYLIVKGAHAKCSDPKDRLEETGLEVNLEPGLSAAPAAETTDKLPVNNLSHSFSGFNDVSAENSFQRKSEPEVYGKLPQAEDRSVLDFSTQDEEIVFPGRTGGTSYANIHDTSASTVGHPTIPIESAEAAVRNQNENKLHPFGVLWSELESTNASVSQLPNRPYGAMAEPAGVMESWSNTSWKNTRIEPNMSLDALAASRMSQLEQEAKRFDLVDSFTSNQHHQQPFQNRNMLPQAHLSEPDRIHGQNLVHRQQFPDNHVQDLEHMLTLQLQQQQQKIQMHQHQHQLQQQQQQQQLQQEHQLHQKLLQEQQQQSHARQLLLQQFMQGQTPDPRFGHSHVDFPRANNVIDQILLEQQILHGMQQGPGHPSRHFGPSIEQLAAVNFGQLPQEDHQRELLEHLLSTKLQSHQHDQLRALEYQMLQQEQLMQSSKGTRHNSFLEEQRHIDPLWPSDQGDQLLRTHSGLHRSHSSGIRPLDYQQQQQRPPFEEHLGQLDRNLSLQENIRQGLFEQGSLPFERAASLPVNASGLNLDAVNALRLAHGLEMRDPTAHMQAAGGLGRFTPGFHLQNPHNPLAQSHVSQLESMGGRWAEADTQLTGDWAESQFRRLHIDAEQQKLRSEVGRASEDPNSWMSEGSTEDKSKRLLMDLLHQRPDHQSTDLPDMNRRDSYDRMAPSGLLTGSSSSVHPFGGLSDHESSLNFSSAMGSHHAFPDEQLNRLQRDGDYLMRSELGSMHRSNSLRSVNMDGGQSTHSDSRGFDMFGMNKDSNDMRGWNNVLRNEGMGRMRYDSQDGMGRQAGFDPLGQGELPAGPYGDRAGIHNLMGEDRRKDRVVVPSHGHNAVLLKRPPSSHSSSSHEGTSETAAAAANRAAISSGSGGMEGGIKQEMTREAAGSSSFSDMLKSNVKNPLTEQNLSEVGAKGGGGGKKKGKKGRQIDPSLLGFKVSSNRILMGDIHRPDD